MRQKEHHCEDGNRFYWKSVTLRNIFEQKLSYGILLT